uniref:FYVE and coiled-coil domain containing 1b n=1 Tax=Denticeps clupeoides TaxID=299321 RepID=A0AAY4AK25_9TELE
IMSSLSVGESQLQRIIRDLHDAVADLSKEHREAGEPITDDSSSLHKFSYKLEYLLQFDQKEKSTFLGTRKDYWDYFCDCLAKIKGVNDGIRFVKSIPELKTSLGKGRAFVRYCLVHQRLADTLQQCLMNQKVTSDWYYARSPFLKSHLNVDIINHLYELNEVQFDVASRGHDLDSEWPTFARRSLGSGVSSTHLWRPPSRCSSVNSLVSSYSQQPQDFLPGPDFSPGFLGDLGELGQLSTCSAAEDLHIQLDQSELRQQELLEQVRRLSEEGCGLRAVIKDLEGKLLVSKNCTHKPLTDGCNSQLTTNEINHQFQATAGNVEVHALDQDLQTRLTVAELKNVELLGKLDGALNDKSQQAANFCDSAWKIQDLLAKLKEVEGERLEARRECEDHARQADMLAQELKLQEKNVKVAQEKLAAVRASAEDEHDATLQQLEGQQATISQLQEALSLKDKEMGNLRTRLQDLEGSLEVQERQMDDLKKKAQDEQEHLQGNIRGLKEELEGQVLYLQQQLSAKEAEIFEKQRHQTESKKDPNIQKVEDYKAQCSTLMELNAKLLQTVKRSEASICELAQAKQAMEKEIAIVRTSEQHLRSRLVSVHLPVEEWEQKLLDENLCLEESLQRTLEPGNQQMGEEQVEDAHHVSRASEDTTRLPLIEAQLDLNVREVSRLQAEVMELRSQLLVKTEERVKAQALQEVTEASREDLRALTEQLKGQVEELNRRHVAELLLCQDREETLVKERENETKAYASLAAEVSALREELHAQKQHNEALALENAEGREALHRANTETAELGVHVCMLTGQNEEARLRWEGLTARLQEHEEEAGAVAEKLNANLEALDEENRRLQEELEHSKGFPTAMMDLQRSLERSQEELRALKESGQDEIQAMKLQLNTEVIKSQRQIQVGLNLFTKLLYIYIYSIYQTPLSRATYNQLFWLCPLNVFLKLFGTPCRDKDALWQKSDALEFKQKLREEETDKDGNQCPGCRSQFSLFLRKHTCRLCGRHFCYYCCNHTVSAQQGGGRERCCKDCSRQHSAVGERHPQEDVQILQQSSFSPLAALTSAVQEPDPSPKPDDGAFDIITDEEVNNVYDSDALSYTTACSPDRGHQGSDDSISTEDATTEDSEELAASVQDAEIYLLKSGELTLSVPLSVEDIAVFGDGFRELFIKSSCYSVIPITVRRAGPTISWVFSSEPKSISFSIVFRESPDTALEQAKVMIPLTRCNSHKETIQGQLKVRNPGEYTLIFDNSFSRFISKKVLYRLSVEEAVVYDGSDCP